MRQLRGRNNGKGLVRRILISLAVLVLLAFLYVWRLGTLTEGLGVAEYNSYQSGQSINQILTQGVNAPYYFMQYLMLKLPFDNLWSLRLTSLFFGVVVLTTLFFFLRSWFGTITAALAGLVFAATPWTVLTIRSAGADVMFLWPIVIFACLNWLMRTKSRPRLAWLLFCIALAIGLYTPGVIWLALATVLIGWRYIAGIITRVGTLYLAIGLVIGVVILEPLAQATILEPARASHLFLIPANWPPFIEVLKSIAWSGLALFWHTRSSVDIAIDRLAILNIMQIVLSLFGVYALAARVRRSTYLALGLLAFSVIAAGINSDLHLVSFGMAAIALFIAAGLRYLYIEWCRIFPLNPFAKILSIGLILLVVGAHTLYGIRYTIVAWPQTEATKSTFVLK